MLTSSDMLLPHAPEVVRFGLFEFSPRTGELRKNGLRRKLQEQPARILSLLLENPGVLVSREQIQKRLWPDEVYVDYENAINSAVRKLREALSDTSGNPRFIETLPRRGYRFIAAVECATGEEVAPSLPDPRPARPTLPRSWLLAPALILVAAAAGSAVFHIGRETAGTRETLVTEPLTSYPGSEEHPSFSPGGNQVAFSWTAEDGSSSDIYVKSIGPGKPLRLTNSPALSFNPAWSPDGRWIAFHRVERDFNLRSTCTVLAVPPLGGPEREITRFKGNWCCVDGWSPDGRWVVVSARNGTGAPNRIVLVSVESGEKRWLTSPSGIRGDTYGVISPNGKTLAFSRFRSGLYDQIASDIYTLILGRDYLPMGDPKRITSDNVFTRGIAWTADSRNLVFSSEKGGNLALWKITVDDPAQRLRLPLGGDIGLLTISPQNNRLAYEKVIEADTNIWRVNLSNPRRPAAPLIASTRKELVPQYSPDGRKIAFQSFRSGRPEIWICDADGSNPWQLTTTIASGTPHWSPDGQSIAFDSVVENRFQVFTVPARGGNPRQLTRDPISSYRASWSHDGKWIWFGRENGIWKVPSGGGQAVRILSYGHDPVETEDGKTVWFTTPESVWKMATDGSDARRVIDDALVVDGGSSFVVTPEGVWYFGSSPRPSIRFYSFATKKSQLLLNLHRPIAPGMAVSPNRHAVLYSQFDTLGGSDLMLVRNFF